MHRQFFLGCAGLVWLVATGSLRAQGFEALTVSDANGQMNFWVHPKHRPDNNYTNGARISAIFDGAPLWGRLLVPHIGSCGADAADTTSTSGRPCTSTDVRFGQDMYTPTNSLDSSTPESGERPYAGWLYVSGTGRVATASQSDAVTLEAGVTGTPSLAEKVQMAWHKLIRYRPPLGWAHQIPFQVGGLADYEHDQRIVDLTSHGDGVFSLTPLVGATVGNVLTGARAGFDARLGYHLATPWVAASSSSPPAVSIYAVSGAQLDYVWYNVFLDRPTTEPTLYVDKLPWVGQYEFGAGIRFHHVVAEYRSVTRTREYVTGRTIEPYSTITVGWHR